MSLLLARKGKNMKGYRMTYDEIAPKHFYPSTAGTHRDIHVDVLASSPEAALLKSMNEARKLKDAHGCRIDFKKLELILNP